MTDDLRSPEASLADALALRDLGDHVVVESDILLKRAVIHAALGELRRAEELLGLAEHGLPDAEPIASMLAGTAAAARALIAVERLDGTAADLVMAANRLNADAEMWPFALLASTRWSTVTGDLVGVLDEADRAMSLRTVTGHSLASTIIAGARARALTMMGEPASARRALELPAVAGIRDQDVVRARLALHESGPESAIAAARGLVVGSGVGPAVRAEAMLLTAWAQLRLRGRIDPGLAGPVAVLIDREGLWRTLQLVPEEVAAAIPGLHGRPAVDRRLALWDPEPSVRLTGSQLEILRLLAGPGTLPQIAAAQYVTVNTVKTHVRSVYRRLGVNGRHEAVAEATRRGILGVPEDGPHGRPPERGWGELRGE